VGFFTPNGDFDFNVVIRVFYTIKKISMYPFCRKRHNSLVNPENEYEECLLKAKAMRQVLQ
jgi:para-aminobenzoate synthetase component 1